MAVFKWERIKRMSHYRNQAKEIVDTLFNAKLFHEKVTRDAMKLVEDLIALDLESNASSVRRSVELTYKLKGAQS